MWPETFFSAVLLRDFFIILLNFLSAVIVQDHNLQRQVLKNFSQGRACQVEHLSIWKLSAESRDLQKNFFLVVNWDFTQSISWSSEKIFSPVYYCNFIQPSSLISKIFLQLHNLWMGWWQLISENCNWGNETKNKVSTKPQVQELSRYKYCVSASKF